MGWAALNSFERVEGQSKGNEFFAVFLGEQQLAFDPCDWRKMAADLAWKEGSIGGTHTEYSIGTMKNGGIHLPPLFLLLLLLLLPAEGHGVNEALARKVGTGEWMDMLGIDRQETRKSMT